MLQPPPKFRVDVGGGGGGGGVDPTPHTHIMERIKLVHLLFIHKLNPALQKNHHPNDQMRSKMHLGFYLRGCPILIKGSLSEVPL